MIITLCDRCVQRKENSFALYTQLRVSYCFHAYQSWRQHNDCHHQPIFMTLLHQESLDDHFPSPFFLMHFNCYWLPIVFLLSSKWSWHKSVGSYTAVSNELNSIRDDDQPSFSFSWRLWWPFIRKIPFVSGCFMLFRLCRLYFLDDHLRTDRGAIHDHRMVASIIQTSFVSYRRILRLKSFFTKEQQSFYNHEVRFDVPGWGGKRGWYVPIITKRKKMQEQFLVQQENNRRYCLILLITVWIGLSFCKS